MPQLSDLISKRKFVKKEYRPWDLSGTGTVDGKEPQPPVAVKSEAIVVAKPSPITEEKSEIIIQTIAKNPMTKTLPERFITDNESGNNSGNKQVTYRKHSDNIKITKLQQPGNIQVTNREHTDNVLDNVTGNAEDLAYLVDSIKKLAGLQKNIFFYVFNVCAARGVLDTGSILSIDLANAAHCSVGSAKTSLIRLIEKQLILRLQGKASRGGHMVLGLTKEIQAAAIQAQHALFNPLKLSQTDNITGNVTSNINAYSSSSIYKSNTTTSLPEEWKKINFELLSHIGFSETQLRQLYDSNTTAPEIVQDAIHRFAYSLEHSDKVKAYGEPLNVLMGVLRKGQRWNEPNYIPAKELALRQILEEKQKRKENYDAMIKEMVEIEFPVWRKSINENEIKKIVSADVLKTNLSPAITAALRVYFIENILLPQIQGET